jgi:hypothetical protein
MSDDVGQVVLSMADASVFYPLKQHCTYEVFARAWHPLLPLLGSLSQRWRAVVQTYWRSVLSAPERIDVSLLYWRPTSPRPAFYEMTSVAFYRRLHACTQQHLRGEYDHDANRNALATCFLYNWPHLAQMLAPQCNLLEQQPDNIASICFRMAAAKRLIEMVELACNLFVIPREDIEWALLQMCAYGYKGIAAYLIERYDLRIDELRARNNYALYHAMRNNHLSTMQWLLRMFPFTSAEVSQVLQRNASDSLFDGPAQLTTEMRRLVDEFIRASRVDAM